MKTVIEQNFEIENGFVIFKDRILLGPNNAWLPDVPQSRKIQVLDNQDFYEVLT